MRIERMLRSLPLLAALPLLASAAEWEHEWNNRVSIGTAVRIENRDPFLVGKSNLDPSLCAQDECLSVSPDNREPNDRYLAAPGARNSVYDDGNLNYDKGDFIASPVKWNSRFQLHRNNFKFEVGTLAFYDYINATLKENHPNQIVTPGGPGVPVRSKRDIKTIQQIGYDVQLLDAFVQDTFEVEGQPIDVSIGRQRLVWGEATFATQGSLNFLNPPDVNNLARPGGTLEEVYRPVGLAIAKGPINDSLSFEAFYQFEWRPVGIPARGSYLSFFNASNHVTGNEGIIAPFAKAPYDPLQIGTPANDILALVSETSFTLRRAPNQTPSNQGQYGAAFYWHPELLGGSELGFYYSNYHSRIPSASAYASDASCARREGNLSGIDATSLVSFISACGVPGTHQREAVPLDTARYFLDYPENLHLFGASFSTLLSGIAVRGEFAFRPNQPVQVDIEDVLFAALQPALPRQDIPLFTAGNSLPDLIAALQDPTNALAIIGASSGNLQGAIGTLQALLGANNVLGTTVPGSRTAIPDFITAYRGGTPGEVVPGSYIRGYERLAVQQASLGLTKVFGNTHFLGTKDAALLFEATNIWVIDLPSKSRLQFEGPGTDTHGGPGAFDTNNALRINPIRNVGGYVTPFSLGYRLGALLHYADVGIPGLDVTPFLVFTHDVTGVSPGLAENFIEGRKLGVADFRFNYGDFDVNLVGAFFFGGGKRNTLGDRDFVSASIAYKF